MGNSVSLITTGGSKSLTTTGSSVSLTTIHGSVLCAPVGKSIINILLRSTTNIEIELILKTRYNNKRYLTDKYTTPGGKRIK
jgi:hypothetical protein